MGEVEQTTWRLRHGREDTILRIVAAYRSAVRSGFFRLGESAELDEEKGMRGEAKARDLAAEARPRRYYFEIVAALGALGAGAFFD